MDLKTLVSQSNVDPRPYQARIVQSAVEMFSGEHRNSIGHLEPAARSVMVESPTGSGKSIMGLLIAKLMQERHGAKVGWVAMRRNLLTQVEVENGVKGIRVSSFNTISMYEKNPPLDLDLLVVDEAQHDAASSMVSLHNKIEPKWILGLTATPFRTDRVKLCFDKVIKDAGIHQLIQEGYLSQYDHYTIPAWNVEIVSEHYLREPSRWGKSIFFFHKLEECFRLKALFDSAGVVSDVVTGSSNREEQLEAFRSGRVPVLINCMVLTEGFDCPDLQTVFCRDSAKGPTMQMCGRAFRLHPSVPVKNIVQSKNTSHPFTRIAKPLNQYLWQQSSDGDWEWRSLTINPLINSIARSMTLKLASTETKMPKYIEKNRGRGRPFWRNHP